jgi:hypothetical protein
VKSLVARCVAWARAHGVIRAPLFTVLLGAILPTTALAQPEYCERETPRKVARAAAASAAIGGNVVLLIYFKNVWWSGERADRFRFINDFDQEFRDQDKLGHAYGGYHLGRIGRDLLIAGCVSENRAAWLSFLYATAFQLQIEIWDATQDKYGFSPGDLLFNTVGATYALAQHYHPSLRHIKPTISYSPSRAMKACRRDQATCGELRTTLDYSGQTYWISADVDGMLPERLKSAWPGILRLSLGHSITEWIVPGGDPGCAPSLGQCVRRAQRKIVLSLDLDASKLPGSHPVWKRIKNELSYIRLPAPALVLTPDLKVDAWYR